MSLDLDCPLCDWPLHFEEPAFWIGRLLWCPRCGGWLRVLCDSPADEKPVFELDAVEDVDPGEEEE